MTIFITINCTLTHLVMSNIPLYLTGLLVLYRIDSLMGQSMVSFCSFCFGIPWEKSANCFWSYLHKSMYLLMFCAFSVSFFPCFIPLLTIYPSPITTNIAVSTLKHDVTIICVSYLKARNTSVIPSSATWSASRLCHYTKKRTRCNIN